jgi:hypothetical protein
MHGWVNGWTGGRVDGGRTVFCLCRILDISLALTIARCVLWLITGYSVSHKPWLNVFYCYLLDFPFVLSFGLCFVAGYRIFP